MIEPHIPRRYAVMRGSTMRVSEADSLWRAITTSDRHEFVESIKAKDSTGPADWRLLANDERIEAIVVGASDSDTLESARQLAIRGKPLIIPATIKLPADFVTEMALYEAEGTSTLIPWFAARMQYDMINDWLAESELGSLKSIQLDRSMSESVSPTDPFSGMMSDIDLLRWLGGDYSQVTFLRTGGGDNPIVSQTLRLAGPSLPDASCTYHRSNIRSGPVLRIDGTDNFAELFLEDNECVWKQGGTEVHRLPLRLESHSGLDRVRSHLDRLWVDDGRSPRWRDLVRVFEIGEAMQRSLRRRRTIDLHFETTSERSQFKTHMATIGCGVILWTMFGIIGLLFAGAVLDPRDRMQREAEAAGFVVDAGDFEAGTSLLTDQGMSHLAEIAEHTSLNDSVVIIPLSHAEKSSLLDDERLGRVRQLLADQGVKDADTRAVARPLSGTWFITAMQIARVLVFAPVALYLVIQGLLIVAKPAASRTGHESSEVAA